MCSLQVTVTWKATDAAGNTGTATQRIFVGPKTLAVDQEPPVLTVPANTTATMGDVLVAGEVGRVGFGVMQEGYGVSR